MEGNNQLRLCIAEMVVALQIYIDHLMPNSEAKVKSVKQDKNNEFVFVIDLSKDK